jgi:hypothetical protein
VRYAFTETSFVGLAVGFGWDGYGFSPGLQIGGEDPWDEIQTFRISMPILLDLSEKWRMFATPILRLTAEDAADWDDGFTGGGIIGFSYRITDRLRIGPGVGVVSELEGNPSVFPVILVDWKVTDRLRLETGRSLGANQGPGLLASYTLLPWLEASLGFRYEKLRFRLESNTTAQGGIGEDRGFPVLAGLQIGYPFAQLTVFAGARFGGQFRIEDGNGRELARRNYDPSPFVGASAQLLF